jgi:hypothetical protein
MSLCCPKTANERRASFAAPKIGSILEIRNSLTRSGRNAALTDRCPALTGSHVSTAERPTTHIIAMPSMITESASERDHQMAGRGFDQDVWRRLRKGIIPQADDLRRYYKPINDCFGSPIVSGRCSVLNFPVPAGTRATSVRHPLRASGP